jgi:hypothetical protein
MLHWLEQKLYTGLKHDGTAIYVHNTVIKILNTMFLTYWISHGGPMFCLVQHSFISFVAI